jgi:hypothetical protein
LGDAKRLIVKPISSADARDIVKALHYSGKVCRNSQVHLGVFLDGVCGGALQYGPSMDRGKTAKLVTGTSPRQCIELNRAAFADWLPRNGESRAIAYSLRWLRSMYPHLKWVISFADGTQCGDGTIYRAAGFLLTAIKPNKSMLRMPDGSVVARLSLDTTVKTADGRWGSAVARENGATPLDGFQLRYVYFLDPSWQERLTCPVLPYAAIGEAGATMYKGKRPKQATTSVQEARGGAAPTRTLQ